MRSEENTPKVETMRLFLLHDNAPTHLLDLVNDFSAKNNVTTQKHHPHFPDLTPADFYLFSQPKSALEARRFDATDIKNATEHLKRFSHNDFQKCFQRL
jgi:hypothetical protein